MNATVVPASDDALARIEARLARIEGMLGRVEQIAAQLPGMAGAAGDVLDEWAMRDGHVDERVRALTALIDRITKPEVLHALTVLVEQVEAAPGMVAMAVDILDELAVQAAARGIDLHELTSNLGEAARGVVMLASRPEVRELVESDMFEAGAIETLSDLARSLSRARREAEPERIGLFGTFGAMRDADVQRAVGFAVRVAKELGRAMDGGERRLASGELEQ